MFKERYKSEMSKIAPSEDLLRRTKMLVENKKPKKNVFVKPIIALVAVAAVLAICLLGLPKLANPTDMPNGEPNAPNSIVGNAFSIVAYAADNIELATVSYSEKGGTINASGEQMEYGGKGIMRLEFGGENLSRIDIDHPIAGNLTVDYEISHEHPIAITSLHDSMQNYVIKITATYKDGSTETKDITVKAE